MAIDQKTLSYISGKHALDTTNQLLDNTLATINNGVQLKNQAQLHQMRNLEIKQTMAEMAEFEKDAYNRGLQRELLRKKGEFDIANFEQVAEMQLESTRNAFINSEKEAQDDVIDMWLNAPDNDAAQLILEQHGGHLPTGIHAMLAETDKSNSAAMAKLLPKLITDREHEQAKELKRIEAAGRAASSGTIKAKGSASNMAVALQNNLGVSDSSIAMDLAETASQVSEDFKNYNINAKPMDVAKYMWKLAEENPEQFWENPNASSWNPFSSRGQLNTDLLSRVAMEKIYQNGGVPYIHAADANQPEPWEVIGMSPANWNQLKQDYPNKSDAELVQMFRDWSGQ